MLKVVGRSTTYFAITGLVQYKHLLCKNAGTNQVLAGGFGVPLSEWTCTTVPCWWPSPGGGGQVTATVSFGGNCCTDRPSHGAFYDWRSRFLSLPLGRETASRSWWRHQRPFRFSENILRQFYLLAPSRHSKNYPRFILSPCFIMRFYVFSIMRLIVVLRTVVLQSSDITSRYDLISFFNVSLHHIYNADMSAYSYRVLHHSANRIVRTVAVAMQPFCPHSLIRGEVLYCDLCIRGKIRIRRPSRPMSGSRPRPVSCIRRRV